MSTTPEQRIAALSPEQRELLMRRLRDRAPSPAATAPPELPQIPEVADRTAPVPLTDVQEAFWLGRSGLFDLGGCGANVYLEYEFEGIVWPFAEELNTALRALVTRQEILRTIVLPDGRQQVLEEVPPFEVEIEDLSGKSEAVIERHLLAIREEMRYARLPTDRWPLFNVVMHQINDGKIRLHARFDAMLIDGHGRGVLLNELGRLLAFPDYPLPRAEVTFLDYARALVDFQSTATWQRARAYWMDRLPMLPPAPRLPLARDIGPDTVPRIVKRDTILLDATSWAELKAKAARAGLSPTGAITAAFAEALRPWSENASFTLGFGGSYRPPIDPRIEWIIGTFTTLHLLAVEDAGQTFVERARQLHGRILSDLDHQQFSGLRVLREYNRLHEAGARATLPIHFNSVIEYGDPRQAEAAPPAAAPPAAEPAGTADAAEPAAPESAAEEASPPEAPAPAPWRPRFTLNVTDVDLLISLPQVLFLGVAIQSVEGELELITQAVEEVFPDGLVLALLDVYRRLLEHLAADDSAWLEARPVHRLLANGEPVPAPMAENAAGTTEPLAWVASTLAIGPLDRWLATAPAGSDLALAESMIARSAGATLVRPAPDVARDPGQLAAFAARERVTIWSSPASLLEAVVHHAERDRRTAPRTLRLVLLHREGVPASLPARLAAIAPQARLLGVWGTPEIPVAALGDLLPAASGDLAFTARPAPGVRLLVLDPEGAPRPDGVPGALWIEGPDGRPVSTAERGCRLPGGGLAVLGRDRPSLPPALGYGSEPGRIETALQRHSGVRHAAIAWVPRAEGGGRLLAWVLLRAGRPPGDEDLRRHLRTELPEHLVPEAFLRLDQFPLTAAGFLDRAALVSATPHEETADRAEAAWDPVEAALAGIWEEVLGCRPTALSDDFFALGGDSLAAVRLLARITGHWGGGVAASELLARPTLGSLAAAVRRGAPRPGLLRRLASRLRGTVSDNPPSAAHTAARASTTKTQESDMAKRSASHGMRIYWTIWAGQFISSLGTGLGSFALCVWIYEQTKSASQFSTMMFLAAITGLLVTPIGGSIADRFDRRTVMIVGNVASSIMAILMASALYTHTMKVWYSYIIAVVMTALGNLAAPSFFTSVSLLVNRQQLVRVAGIVQLTSAVAGMGAPLVAGALIHTIGYHGVILIDVCTFFFAIGTLAIVRIPRPPVTTEASTNPSIWGDFVYGWRYLRDRPGLFQLLLLFGLTNFAAGIVTVLLGPLVLSFSTPAALGTVNSAATAGLLLGSFALSIWGGVKRRVWGIFFGLLIQASLLFLGGVKPSVPLVAFALCIAMATSPMVNGSNQAIWQVKIPHDIQGRVLGARATFGMLSMPLAYLVAGPLADKVFQPLLMPGGLLAGSVGRLIGVGPGRGVGLLFITLGLFMIGVVLIAYLNPRLRNVENELPDVVRPTFGGGDAGPGTPPASPAPTTPTTTPQPEAAVA